jgi:hypothetical protein
MGQRPYESHIFATSRLVSLFYERLCIYHRTTTIADALRMSLLIHARTPQLGRAAARWNMRAAITRATRCAGPAMKQGLEVVLTVAGMLAIVLATLALDVWILIPRPDH